MSHPTPVSAVTPRSAEAARDSLSRRLKETSAPLPFLNSHPVGLELFGNELVDLVNVSHIGAPSSGDGWGIRPGERRQMEIAAIDEDPNSRRIRLDLKDLRWSLQLSSQEFYTQSMYSDTWFDGIRRHLPTNGASLYRGQDAWIKTVADGLVFQIHEHTPKLEEEGLLIERMSYNRLTDSAFTRGVGAPYQTEFGSTSGVITTTTDATINITTTDVSPYSALFTAGTPHTANHYLLWPYSPTVYTSDSKATLSIDHQDSTGGALFWEVQRESDNNNWNVASSSWAVGLQYNTVTLSTSGDRFVSTPIIMASTACGLRVAVGQQSSGDDGRTNRLFTVQLDPLPWASSRIVTGASSSQYYRRVDAYCWANPYDAKAWDETRGTFYAKIRPEWDYDDVSGYEFTLVRAIASTGEYARVYYDGTAQAFKFSIVSAGTTYTATAASPSSTNAYRGQLIGIGARWATKQPAASSTNLPGGQELDTTYNTYTTTARGERFIDIFVHYDSEFQSGYNKAGATSGAFIFSSSDDSRVEVGWNRETLDAADAHFEEIGVTPLVLTQEELLRLIKP